jgi:hypothetical protein
MAVSLALREEPLSATHIAEGLSEVLSAGDHLSLEHECGSTLADDLASEQTERSFYPARSGQHCCRALNGYGTEGVQPAANASSKSRR